MASAAGADGRLHVLYGSQTGTAEEVAWDLVREGRRRGHRCGDPLALNDCSLQALQCARFAVFVVSTTGQGDPPVNMRKLWQEMVSASLPETLLAGLRFAVFGLGDSRYKEFNYAARKLHARLGRLGGEAFFRIGLGDDQHDFGFEQELDPWADGMWAALAEAYAPEPTVALAGGPPAEDCRYSVEFVQQPVGSSTAERPLVLAEGDFEAKISASGSLCAEEHAKEVQDVWNVRLQAPPGYRFEAGDVCVVWPRTDPKLVRRFVVETLELELDAAVRIRARGGDGGSATSSTFPQEPLTLEEVFTSYVDISAVPSRYFFHVLSLHTTDKVHKKKLAEFASRTLEAKDALYEYCKRERRSAAEVMWDFWTARPPLADLLSCLPPMRPRRYSIASCPSWYDDSAAVERLAAFWARYVSFPSCTPRLTRLTGPAALQACAEAFRANGGAAGDAAPVHVNGAAGCKLDLCVGIVRYTTRNGRECGGLCSTFLERAPVGSGIRCALERGELAAPPLGVPLIFVCPGTGLSPCRALVQERHLQVVRAAPGQLARFRSGLKDLIFLGFRHRAGDFLYGAEWPMFESWLDVHIAFSRDDDDRKVYVQDRIDEQGAKVCALLDAGARVLVCGRAHPMPAQVFDAFTEALEVHRGLSHDAAVARLREMQRSKAYICDTWG